MWDHHGYAVSPNGIASILTASARSVRPYERRILAYMQGYGWAIIDETTVRALGEWGYAVVAHVPRAAWIRYTRSKSAADLKEALGPIWYLAMVTDEAKMYPNGKRQTCLVHLGRDGEEPVVVWLAVIGDEGAREAGIDPRRELDEMARHILPPLVELIKSEPRVELREGAVLPSLGPRQGPKPEGPAAAGGGGDAAGGGGADAAGGSNALPPAPTAATLFGSGKRERRLPGRRRGNSQDHEASGGAQKKGRGGEAASTPPSAKQIAAYRRDAFPYYAMLCVVGLLKMIDTAPSRVSLAFLYT